MRNTLNTSIVTCCLIAISSIGMVTSARELQVIKATNQEAYTLRTQSVFPLKQNKGENVVEGKVRFYSFADNTFAINYLEDLDKGVKAWIMEHYDRMQVYAPWFDEYTEWYPNGLEYKDLYAIYDCSQPKG